MLNAREHSPKKLATNHLVIRPPTPTSRGRIDQDGFEVISSSPSPSSSSSFPDNGSVIECTPSLDDRELFSNNAATCNHGSCDSISSPLSSANVTPTYTFTRRSISSDYENGILDPAIEPMLRDESDSDINYLSDSNLVTFDKSPSRPSSAAIKVSQSSSVREDRDDGYLPETSSSELRAGSKSSKRSFHYPEANEGQDRHDSIVSALQCPICMRDIRADKLVDQRFCSKTCSSIYSSISETSSSDHASAKRFKTPQVGTDSQERQNIEIASTKEDHEQESMSARTSGPLAVPKRDQVRQSKPGKVDIQPPEVDSPKLKETDNTSIQLEELDFNLKSNLIMQSHQTDPEAPASAKSSKGASASSIDASQAERKTNTSNGKFKWPEYLAKTNSVAAPPECFVNPFPETKNQFTVGMCLEARDPKNPSIISVVSVRQVLGHRIRLHFDGYDTCFDFWRNCDSEFIYPAGFCDKNAHVLTPPLGYQPGQFTWSEYLQDKIEAPTNLFHANRPKTRPTRSFEVGMKLEAVDKRNPILIRVATIVDMDDEQIKIHYDDWSSIYDIWVSKESEEVHPATWCAKTHHPLLASNTEIVLINQTNYTYTVSCPTAGCEGIGHIRGPKFSYHHTESGCPYARRYLNKDMLGDRFQESSQQPVFDPKNSKRSRERLLISVASLKKHSKLNTAKRLVKTSHARVNKPGPKKAVAAASSSKEDPNPPRPRIDTAKAKAELAKLIANSSRAHPTLVKPALNSPKPRGRPAKNRPINFATPTPPTEFKIDKNTLEYILLLNNVHESVYLVNSDEKNPESNSDLLNFNYDLNLLPGFNEYLQCLKKRKKIVPTWTKDDVANFIKMIPGCADEADKFIQQEMDGEALMLVQQYDLIKLMKLKIGPAVKIFNYILMLKNMV